MGASRSIANGDGASSATSNDDGRHFSATILHSRAVHSELDECTSYFEGVKSLGDVECSRLVQLHDIAMCGEGRAMAAIPRW
jgi:hypothetical protein